MTAHTLCCRKARKNFVEEQGHVSTIVLENTNFGPNYLNVIPTKKKISFSSLVDLYYKKLCSIVFWILLKFYLKICENLFSILFSKYLHNILDFVSLCVKPQIYSTWLLISALNKQQHLWRNLKEKVQGVTEV